MNVVFRVFVCLTFLCVSMFCLCTLLVTVSLVLPCRQALLQILLLNDMCILKQWINNLRKCSQSPIVYQIMSSSVHQIESKPDWINFAWLLLQRWAKWITNRSYARVKARRNAARNDFFQHIVGVAAEPRMSQITNFTGEAKNCITMA